MITGCTHKLFIVHRPVGTVPHITIHESEDGGRTITGGTKQDVCGSDLRPQPKIRCADVRGAQEVLIRSYRSFRIKSQIV